jgi:hypothetical protein
MPPTMVKLYGPKRGTLLYGILYSAFGTASIGGMYLSKALKANFGMSKIVNNNNNGYDDSNNH